MACFHGLRFSESTQTLKLYATKNDDKIAYYWAYLAFVCQTIRAETNTRFTRVFTRLHKYSDTKRGIRIHFT